MKKSLGRKGFDSPTHGEMEKYLKQGKRSVDRMREGKSPLTIRPPRTLRLRIIGMIVLVLLSSTLFISASLFAPDSQDNSSNDTSTITTTVTTTTTTTEETTIPETPQPIQWSINELEELIGTMTSNLSQITPLMINGTINTTRHITTDELLDLVWILSQYEENSEWWDLGRILSFNTYSLWNKSYLQNETIQIQLEVLRGLLAYPSTHLLLNNTEQETFRNLSSSLWVNVSSYFNTTTGILDFSNNQSEISFYDQIVFMDVLLKSVGHSTIFLRNTTESMVSSMLEMMVSLTATTEGVPDYFNNNLTWFSHTFNSCNQNELILTLELMKREFTFNSTIDVLLARLSQFVEDVFLQQDWSISSMYNSSNQELSDSLYLEDQILFIRTKIMQKRLNFAEYSINTLRNTFESSDYSYYSSTDDTEVQRLQDQVHVLLMFIEFVELETTPEQPGAATWGMSLLLLLLLIIPLRRKRKRTQ
jgi:hypothetical protein